LKLKLFELKTNNGPDTDNIVLPVRIIWSRGKKNAKT